MLSETVSIISLQVDQRVLRQLIANYMPELDDVMKEHDIGIMSKKLQPESERFTKMELSKYQNQNILEDILDIFSISKIFHESFYEWFVGYGYKVLWEITY